MNNLIYVDAIKPARNINKFIMETKVLIDINAGFKVHLPIVCRVCPSVCSLVLPCENQTLFRLISPSCFGYNASFTHFMIEGLNNIKIHIGIQTQ